MTRMSLWTDSKYGEWAVHPEIVEMLKVPKVALRYGRKYPFLYQDLNGYLICQRDSIGQDDILELLRHRRGV